MLYTTAENFEESYGMGTTFYESDGSIQATLDCRHMRLVLFEGDILHSFSSSNIPVGIETSRVSWVYKLVLNPKSPSQCVKQDFRELMHTKAL
jgi:hypothetical protein